MKKAINILFLFIGLVAFAQTGPTQTINGKVIYGYRPAGSGNTIYLTVNPTTNQLEFQPAVSGIPLASQTVAGISKIYNSTGINTDGSMTQQAITDALFLKANLASPAFTGIPTAPTASLGTSTTQLATTAFVQNAVNASNNIVKDGNSFGSTLTIGTNDNFNLQLERNNSIKVVIAEDNIRFNDNSISGATINQGKITFANTNFTPNTFERNTGLNEAVSTFRFLNSNTLSSGDILQFDSNISGTTATRAGVRKDGRVYSNTAALVSQDLIRKGEVDTALALKANDSNVIHKTGDGIEPTLGGFTMIKIIGTSSNGGADIDLYGNTIRYGALSCGYDGTNSGVGDLYLRTFNNGTPTNNITIKGFTNRVGINQLNPAYTLDVNGAGRFSGRLKIFDAATTDEAVTFGQAGLAYSAKTANYTLTANDGVIDFTSGSSTATLPTAVGISGKRFVIKNSGTGATTLATTSSQTIDGNSGMVLFNQNSSVLLVSDGANWKIVDTYNTTSTLNSSMTTTQTAATLNAAYPNAWPPFVVYAPNITTGPMVFIKTTTGGQWMSYSGFALNP